MVQRKITTCPRGVSGEMMYLRQKRLKNAPTGGGYSKWQDR